MNRKKLLAAAAGLAVIAVLVALGVFVGGVENKSQFLKDKLNKLLSGSKTNDKI